MPKRTNQFQKLITYITEQVAPIGATVRESVELEEKGLDEPVLREVDVLVELDAGLSTFGVAIECRDRSRKDSIQWIDDLIGKYANLPVDQVIAVSSSGFSSTAAKKAKLNNIRTMSLEEASETDWPEQFTKLSVALIKQKFYLTHLQFETDPEIGAESNEVSLQDTITFQGDTLEGDEEPYITIEGFMEGSKEEVIQQTQEYIKENFLSVYSTIADLDKDALVMREVPVNDLVLQTGGENYKIETITFVVRVRTIHSKAKVERHLLSDKAMVTSAVLPSGEDTEVELKAIQVANKSEGKLFRTVRKAKTKAT